MRLTPIVRANDVRRSVEWYARLGFEMVWEFPTAAGEPAFVCIAHGDNVRIFLSEHDDDASSDTLMYLEVDDVDAVATATSTEVIDLPWARELRLVDPDGNRVRVGTPSIRH